MILSVQVYHSSCPEGECTEEMHTERIIGNPIYNYQLLKRVTVYWSNVEKAIGKVDNKATLARIKKLKTKQKKMPTEDDLKAAAKALNKLQDMYSIKPEQLVLGNIGNLSNTLIEFIHCLFTNCFMQVNLHSSDFQIIPILANIQAYFQVRYPQEPSCP